MRSGVAPDHPKIKSISRTFEKTAEDPRFRFFGNVTVGEHVSTDELSDRYDAVVYAVGTQSDRTMGIPGEDADGVVTAVDFLGDLEDRGGALHLVHGLQHPAAVGEALRGESNKASGTLAEQQAMLSRLLYQQHVQHGGAQPEALRLYARAGYRERAAFGDYRERGD